jgi:hypothetical protein
VAVHGCGLGAAPIGDGTWRAGDGSRWSIDGVEAVTEDVGRAEVSGGLAARPRAMGGGSAARLWREDGGGLEGTGDA